MAAKSLRYINLRKHIILKIKLTPKNSDVKPLNYKQFCFIWKQISAPGKRQTASLKES